MSWKLAGISLLGLALGLGGSTPAAAAQNTPRVSLQTSMGEIVLELDREHAPATVDNFLRYVREKHYDGMVFYRVVPRFVIQAGSYDAQGNHRQTRDPIPLEANNHLSNTRGSVAMARQDEPNSATAEFFIDLSDLKGLDQQADDMENKTGYAVFGHVVGGMDVVDAIAQVPLGGNGPFAGAAPTTPIVIQKAAILDAAPPP